MEITIPLHEALKLVKTAIELYLEGTDIAIPYLIGPPGGGKTESIKSTFKDYNIFTLHLAYMPIEEIAGLPINITVQYNGKSYNGTEWSLPEIISKLYELANDKKTILFIDDFHLCSPAQMSYGYQLFTDRKLRNYKLPDNVAIILAGNSSPNAGAKVIQSGITNRCSLIKVHTDYDHWKKEFGIFNVHPVILSFFSNDVNRKYFHMDEQVNKPWSSPRSISRLSNLITRIELDHQLTYNEMLTLSTSHIGEEAAAALTQYYILYKDINVTKIFDTNTFDDAKNYNIFIYMHACLNEFYNRYLSNNKNEKKKAIQTLGLLIGKFINDHPEIIVALLKELIFIDKTIKIKSFADVRLNIDPTVNMEINKILDVI